MAGNARKVAVPKAAATPVEESVTIELTFKEEKVHSRIYIGDELGKIYLPRDLLARLGTPDALEISIKAKQ